MLINFRKAFNTISHNYILKSLEFFNFSDYMINIAETLLTGRHGSVLTDTGQTQNFSFDSGTPLEGVAFADGTSKFINELQTNPK